MGSKAGDINGWKCRDCNAVTYCIHVDDGVTPMFLGCRATEDCGGMATSLMYPRPPMPSYVPPLVAWEWYKPTAKQIRRLERKHPGMADHVRMGGLDLRPLTDAGRQALSEHHGYTETESG